jgi:hypothetical protein
MRHQNCDPLICRLRRKSAGVALTTAMFCAAVSGIGLSIMLTPASAATEVEGQADEVQIHAENASIREIFDALSAKFNLTYSLPSNVGGVLTGLYSGSLKQVLARVLAGNDYVLGILDDRVRIVVLNASNAAIDAPAGAALASNENQVAQLSPTPSPRPVSSSKPIPPLTSYLR